MTDQKPDPCDSLAPLLEAVEAKVAPRGESLESRVFVSLSPVKLLVYGPTIREGEQPTPTEIEATHPIIEAVSRFVADGLSRLDDRAASTAMALNSSLRGTIVVEVDLIAGQAISRLLARDHEPVELFRAQARDTVH